MTELWISLRFRETLRSETACAWLLPGASARSWLAAISELDLDAREIGLLLLPTSRQDPRAACALAFTRDGAPRSCRRALAPRWNRRGKWFHPADAELAPPVTGAELDALVPADFVVVHPSLGVVAFEAKDVTAVERLMAIRIPAFPERWITDPGTTLAPRLLEVSPAALPPILELFVEERRTIATEDPFRDLRASSQSSDSVLPKRWIARITLALCRLAPERAPHPTWVDALKGWATSILGPDAADTRKGRPSSRKERRRQEIERLLRQLDEDPEAGLRRALPLWSPPARGQGIAGDSLGARDTEFSLKGLRASRRVDAWDLQREFRQRLETSYRAIAARERARGNHRRAAYVLAHLIGDLRAAAEVLEEGGHVREAASLLQHECGSPVAAAECLQRAELLHEAVPLFERARRHEAAARIWRRLGRYDLARSCFQRAVDDATRKGHHLEAARLLEQDLERPEEALALLESGWNVPAVAEECAIERVRLLQRIGRTSAAEHEPRALRERVTPDDLARLMRVLRRLSGREFATGVARVARDEARLVAATVLRAGPSPTARTILDELARLRPEDPILVRDAARFASRLALEHAPLPPAPTAIPLPKGYRWMAIAADGNHLVAVGCADGDSRERAYCIVPWSGASTLRRTPSASPTVSAKVRSIGPTGSFLLTFQGADPMAALLHTNGAHAQQIAAELPEWYGIDGSDSRILFGLEVPRGNRCARIVRLDRSMQPAKSCEFPPLDRMVPHGDVHFAAYAEWVFVAHHGLLRAERSIRGGTRDLDPGFTSRVRDLVATGRATRAAALVVSESNELVIATAQPNSLDLHVGFKTAFADRVAIHGHRDFWVATARGTGLRIEYQAHLQTLVPHVFDFEPFDREIVALTRGPAPESLAALLDDGTVRIVTPIERT